MGSGMFPLACLCAKKGFRVRGSDREIDQDADFDTRKIDHLRILGAKLFPHDGSGTAGADLAVFSRAVEKNSADMTAARARGVEIMYRAELLAGLFNQKNMSCAIAGTSGKSTISAMTSFIAVENGIQPDCVIGAEAAGAAASSLSFGYNAGQGHVFIAETDESDKTLPLYKPAFAVISTISKDHMEVDEALQQFSSFAGSVTECLVLNADDPLCASLPCGAKEKILISLQNKPGCGQVEIVSSGFSGSTFKLNGGLFRIQLPGAHNIFNAACAVSLCLRFGLSHSQCSDALERFNGIRRRLEFIGEGRGVKVFDDYAHNPEKLRCAISALLPHCRRLHVVFNPHGFRPTKLMFDGYVEVFSSMLRGSGSLYVGPIYYRGGTVDKSISHTDLAAALLGKIDVSAFEDREYACKDIERKAADGDIVVVAGARDPSIPAFARNIVTALKEGL